MSAPKVVSLQEALAKRKEEYEKDPSAVRKHPRFILDTHHLKYTEARLLELMLDLYEEIIARREAPGKLYKSLKECGTNYELALEVIKAADQKLKQSEHTLGYMEKTTETLQGIVDIHKQEVLLEKEDRDWMQKCVDEFKKTITAIVIEKNKQK